MKNMQEQLNVKEISTPRKHLYFYVLLVLGTVFTHQMQRVVNQEAAGSTPGQQVAQLQETVMRSAAALPR
jgi:hypothetical protein